MATSNIDEVLRKLNGSLKRQIPFAMSKALNDTTFDAKRDLEAGLHRHLDNPTPFTIRAFGVRRSSKTKLTATIFIKDIQAEYLRYAIDGGRRDKNVQPVNIRVNKYGNIPGLRGGRKIAKLLAKPNTFKANINGTIGIWQRNKSGLKLLATLDSKPVYKKRYPFEDIGIRSFKRHLLPNARKSVINAIRTAR